MDIPNNDITIDETLWPIVIVYFRGEIPSDRVHMYFDKISGYLDKKELYLTISELSHTSMKNGALREATQRFTALRRQEISTLNLISIVAVKNPVIRTSVKAFIRFTPVTTFPIVMVESIEEGLSVAKEHLQKAGIPYGAPALNG